MRATLTLYGPLVATVTMWSFQAPALHVLGERWDPATLNVLRYLLAAAAFGAIAALSHRATAADHTAANRTAANRTAADQTTANRMATATAARPSVPMTRGFALGLLFACFGLLYATGAVIGNPVVSATAAAVMPITASLVTWAVTGKAPERALLLALVLVVPGAILATPAAGGQGGDRPVLGLALVMVAQVCWSLYSLSVPRWLPDTSSIVRTRISILWALPLHAVVFVGAWTLGFGRADPSQPAFDATIATIAALGPLVLGLILWNLSIARLGLPICALFLNLVPVVGTLIAWGFGTVPSLTQVLGVALVIAGMSMAQYRRRTTVAGRSPLPRP
ncbi:MAG: DMT family transporter [Pseudomonadota bacterium]